MKHYGLISLPMLLKSGSEQQALFHFSNREFFYAGKFQMVLEVAP